MNADEAIENTVGCPSSWEFVCALTDSFTSSNLLLIRSIISDKCGRRHGERGILAQSRQAFTNPEIARRHLDGNARYFH